MKGRCSRCQLISRIPKAAPFAPPVQFPPPYADEDEDILPFRWVKRVLGGTPPIYRDVQSRAAARLAALKRIQNGLNDVANGTPKLIQTAAALLRERAYQTCLESVRAEQLADVGHAKARTLQEHGYANVAQLRNVSSRMLQSLPGIGPVTAERIVRAVKVAVDEASRRPFILPLPGEVTPDHHVLLRGAGRLVNLAQHLPAHIRPQLEGEIVDLERQLAGARRRSNLLVRMWYSEERRRQEAKAHQDLLLLLSTSSDRVLTEGAAALEAMEPLHDPVDLVNDYRARFAHYASVLDRYFVMPPKASVRTEPAEAAPVIRRGIFGALPESIAGAVERTTLSLRTIKMHLRGYQVFGAKYLIAQQRTVLGDEMGLGKTIQAMAALTHLYETQKSIKCLVVAPASIVGNWARELEDKTALPVRFLHGQDRERENRRWLQDGGVGITSYETLPNVTGLDQEPLDMLIADEAHYIKNPEAKRSQNVAAVSGKAHRVVLMTGTPLENRPTEFANLIRICNKSLAAALGSRDAVVDPASFELRIAPVYLRRNQDDVLSELPECIVTDEWTCLSSADETAYRKAVETGALMTMRRAAIGTDLREGKLQRLLELLESYREIGAKVVVFSYFLEVLDRVGELVGPHCRIDGSVPAGQRMSVIDQFAKQQEFAVMICQIAAGGVGINLQCASVVFLMEPQLKPTTEWQAISRLHRMGQTRRVVAHRLLARDTVEERLIEILEQKAAAFDEYARESAVKRVSSSAVDTSDASLEVALVQAEMQRLNVA